MTHTPEVTGIDQLLSLPDAGQYQPLVVSDLRDLVSTLQEHAAAFGTAAGVLNISIVLKADRSGQIDLVCEHKVKKPSTPKAKGAAWITENGGLTVINPYQRRMEIREVSGDRRELRMPSAD